MGEVCYYALMTCVFVLCISGNDSRRLVCGFLQVCAKLSLADLLQNFPLGKKNSL